MKILSFWVILAGAILCGCLSPQRPPSPAALEKSLPAVQRTASGGAYGIPEPLVALNKLFLEGYKERQAAVRSNTTPVIVANFSSVVLYRNGTAETNRAIPDIYHALKAIAHVPFGIFVRVDPYASTTPQELPTGTLLELKQYQTKIAEAEAVMAQAGYSPAQLARQKEILGTCQAFLVNIERQRKVSRQDLQTFTRKLGPLMLANANDAAAAQLDMTHAAVMAWKRKVPAEEWNRLVVVVRGFQMARRLNIFTVYFAKVLNEPGHNLGYPLESRRLIFAEFIMKDRDHLDLMATTFIDGDASEAFFGDRWRMSRDVLADGAEAHLKQLKFE
jgi:hypothetical protein